MADLWQSVCEKTELQDITLRDAALRELEEETGFGSHMRRPTIPLQ